MKILPLIFLLFCSLQLSGQTKKSKPDTLYYLADTTKTPIKDRLLKIYNEDFSNNGKQDTIQSFSISCPCLPNNHQPKFIRQIHRTRTLISQKRVGDITFTSLADLLALIVKDYKRDFNQLHVVMVVEAIKKEYYLEEVSLIKYWGPVD